MATERPDPTVERVAPTAGRRDSATRRRSSTRAEGGTFASAHLSGGRPWVMAALATLAVMIPHVAFRSLDWRYEWTATTVVYAFSVVILGPICAGIVAMWAAAFRRTAGPTIMAGVRRTTVVVRETAAILRPVFTLWVLGLCAELVTTWVTSSPGVPSLADFLPVVAGIVFLFLCGVLGWAAGWNLPKMWVGPVLAIAAFGVILWWYGIPLSPLVEIGGATASLVGLRPSFGYHLPQMALLLVLIGVFAWMSIDARRVRRVVAAACIGAVLLGASAIGVGRFTRVEPHRFCQKAGSGRSYCVAAGYRQFLPDVVTEYEKVAARFDELGIELPQVIRQGDVSGRPSIDVVGDLEHPSTINQTLLWSMADHSCEALLDAESVILMYMTSVEPSSNDLQYIENVAPEFVAADDAERVEYVHRSLEAIKTCSPIF